MNEGDSQPVRCSGDDLVTEHGAGRGDPDFLHVRPAQAAGEHVHERTGSTRLADVGEPRLPSCP